MHEMHAKQIKPTPSYMSLLIITLIYLLAIKKIQPLLDTFFEYICWQDFSSLTRKNTDLITIIKHMLAKKKK